MVSGQGDVIGRQFSFSGDLPDNAIKVLLELPQLLRVSATAFANFHVFWTLESAGSTFNTQLRDEAFDVKPLEDSIGTLQGRTDLDGRRLLVLQMKTCKWTWLWEEEEALEDADWSEEIVLDVVTWMFSLCGRQYGQEESNELNIPGKPTAMLALKIHWTVSKICFLKSATVCLPAHPKESQSSRSFITSSFVIGAVLIGTSNGSPLRRLAKFGIRSW